MKPREYEKEFKAIMDALSESIIEATDQEIIEDYIENGQNPDEVADKVRAMLLNTANVFQKRNLICARKKYESRVREIRNSKDSIPATLKERRNLLASVFNKNPFVRDMLTAQYRDFKNLSDSDIESLLQQLKALGALENLKEE